MCKFLKILNLQKPEDPFEDYSSDESGNDQRNSDSDNFFLSEDDISAESDDDQPDELEGTKEVVNIETYIPEETTQSHKVSIAQQIAQVLTGPQGGLPIVLSGGAAVTMLGGPRLIKDLDFRILLGPDRTFRMDDELSNDLIEAINRLLKDQFKNVRSLVRADPETGMTIKGYVEKVEVSITRTPLVEYMATGDGPQNVPQLGEFDLILDKAYSIVARRNEDVTKKITDLIDLLAILEKQPGFLFVLRLLDQTRGNAYEQQMWRNKSKATLLLDLKKKIVKLLKKMENKNNQPLKVKELVSPELVVKSEDLVDKIEQLLDNKQTMTII